MTKVTVEAITSIGQYGETIKEVGEDYQRDLNGAYQKLTLKSKGSEAEAVDAYLQKVNTLQEKVFNLYPSEVLRLGSGAKNYSTALEGAGFVNRVWSNDTGAVQVALKLEKNQVETIKTKGEEMQSALDYAALYLDEEKVSLDGEIQSTEQAIKDSAKNRKSTDASIQSAYTAFSTMLEETNVQFSSLVSIINNAKFITSLSPDMVLKNIADGSLKKDGIDDMDNIQGAGDGAMYNAIYSKDSYKAMGSVDPTNVSESMMNVAYKKLYQTIPEEMTGGNTYELKEIEEFLISLGNQDSKIVKVYSQKLLEAGDRFAALVLADVTNIMPEFPKNTYDEKLLYEYWKKYEQISPDLAKHNKSLTRAGGLAAIFSTAYVLDIGVNETKNKKGKIVARTQKNYSKDSLKFNPTNDGNELRLDFSIVDRKNDKVVSITNVDGNFYEDASPLLDKEAQKKLSELSDQRSTAQTKFILDLLKFGADFIPGSPLIKAFTKGMIDLGKTASDSSIFKSQFGAYGKDISEAINNKDHKTKISRLSDSISTVARYMESMDKIDSEEKKANKFIQNNFFNIGGYSIGEQDSPYVYSTQFLHKYDLQSYLQLSELQAEGLRPYVFRQGMINNLSTSDSIKNLRVFDKVMDEWQKATPDKNLKGDAKELQKAKDIIAGDGEYKILDSRPSWWDILSPNKNFDDKIAFGDLVGGIDKSLESISKSDEDSRRLLKIYGQSSSDLRSKMSEHYKVMAKGEMHG